MCLHRFIAPEALESLRLAGTQFPHRIGRATGGEEAKSAIDRRLGWGTRQARRLRDQIGRKGRKYKHDDERQQKTLGRHDKALV